MDADATDHRLPSVYGSCFDKKGIFMGRLESCFGLWLHFPRGEVASHIPGLDGMILTLTGGKDVFGACRYLDAGKFEGGFGGILVDVVNFRDPKSMRSVSVPSISTIRRQPEQKSMVV